MRRGGFTLIEVMAVVMLIGLLAAGTAWSLADDARRSSRTRIVAAVGHADRLARMAGRRFGKPCVLRIDLDRQRISRRFSGGESDPAAGHTLQLPANCRVERVLIARPDTSGEGSGLAWAAVDSGTAEIVCSTAGRSVSYAVRLGFRDGADSQDAADDLAGRGVWLVFSGLTGEMTRVRDADAVENLFTLLATGRPDVD